MNTIIKLNDKRNTVFNLAGFMAAMCEDRTYNEEISVETRGRFFRVTTVKLKEVTVCRLHLEINRGYSDRCSFDYTSKELRDEDLECIYSQVKHPDFGAK